MSAPSVWDAAADRYDEKILPFTAKQAERALDIAAVRTGERVLDVAAGTGALAVAAARRGASVTATDVSPRMIDRLRERLTREKLVVDARVMDGQALELPDASFDAAFSILGLIFFPDRARAMRELRRVVKPGGRVVLNAFARPDEQTFVALMGKAAARAGTTLAPPPPGPAPAYSLADPTRFADELRSAGFADVVVTTEPCTFDVARPEDLWSTLDGTPIFDNLTKRLDPARVADVRAAYAEAARAELGTGPVRAPSMLHYALAR